MLLFARHKQLYKYLILFGCCLYKQNTILSNNKINKFTGKQHRTSVHTERTVEHFHGVTGDFYIQYNYCSRKPIKNKWASHSKPTSD